MKGSSDKRTKKVIGLAWYTPEEWAALHRVRADKGSLHASHAAWEADATRQLHDLREQGFHVVPVPIKVAELVAWCKTHNRRIDGGACSEFTSRKAQGGEVTPDGESVPMKATRIPRRAESHPLLTQLEALHAQTHKRSAPPLYPYDEQNALVRLPGPIVEEVRQMVQAGDIPGAVKRVDELIGAGLRVAKDYVDGLRSSR